MPIYSISAIQHITQEGSNIDKDMAVLIASNSNNVALHHAEEIRQAFKARFGRILNGSFWINNPADFSIKILNLPVPESLLIELEIIKAKKLACAQSQDFESAAALRDYEKQVEEKLRIYYIRKAAINKLFDKE